MQAGLWLVLWFWFYGLIWKPFHSILSCLLLKMRDIFKIVYCCWNWAYYMTFIIFIIHFSWQISTKYPSLFVYLNLSQCIWFDKNFLFGDSVVSGLKIFRIATLVRTYVAILIRGQRMMRTFQFDLNKVIKWKGGKICDAVFTAKCSSKTFLAESPLKSSLSWKIVNDAKPLREDPETDRASKRHTPSESQRLVFPSRV